MDNNKSSSLFYPNYQKSNARNKIKVLGKQFFSTTEVLSIDERNFSSMKEIRLLVTEKKLFVIRDESKLEAPSGIFGQSKDRGEEKLVNFSPE